MDIYISNLETSISETELKKLFGCFGLIRSATVIRDRNTRQPTGYGIVVMDRSEAAEKAFETLDGKRLKGQPVRLSRTMPRLSSRSA